MHTDSSLSIELSPCACTCCAHHAPASAGPHDPDAILVQSKGFAHHFDCWCSTYH